MSSRGVGCQGCATALYTCLPPTPSPLLCPLHSPTHIVFAAPFPPPPPPPKQGVLRELKACRLSGLRHCVVHLPAAHPLSSLDLSGCAFLQLVDLGLQGLTSLNLSGCKTLYRLRMRCVCCFVGGGGGGGGRKVYRQEELCSETAGTFF
jgi:hypothetical protein